MYVEFIIAVGDTQGLTGIMKTYEYQGTFEIVSTEVLWSVGGSYQTIWAPLSRMLHNILDDDHIQWHPPLIGFLTVTNLDLITEFDFLPNYARFP